MSPVLAGVADGLQVNIPVLVAYRLTWGGTVLDNVFVVVKMTSKQQVSLGRQIRPSVYTSCNGFLNLRGRKYTRLQYPGKASQEERSQIVPITDTGGPVE